MFIKIFMCNNNVSGLYYRPWGLSDFWTGGKKIYAVKL